MRLAEEYWKLILERILNKNETVKEEENHE